MPDLIGHEKVDRIAVLVSYNGTSKFLGAPKIATHSTGENISNVVHVQLLTWNIVHLVQGMSFDTALPNTGPHVGACQLLQQKIGRDLIKFACRHHIYELPLRETFEKKLSISTSAPDVLIFERFAKSWPSLNYDTFKNGLEDETICSKLPQAELSDIKNFCFEQLTKPQIRDDYRELLQLALIFIGAGKYNFHTPGATSHARWMAKAIYSFKIFLFRDQFTLTKKELDGFRDICIFLIKHYVKAWFECTNALLAPLQDLNFIKHAIKYAETDSIISKAVLNKMSNHLWYLSEETIALAFFDSNVSFEEKRKMVANLKSEEPAIKLKNSRNHSNLLEFQHFNLNDFVSQRTKHFFTRFGLPSAFLENDPSTWEMSFEYEEGWTFCRNLLVVNDTAERGIKFMKDYNKILTNNEEEKQLLLQIVEAYRKKYVSYKKSDLDQ